MQGFFGSDVYPNPKEFLEVLNELAVERDCLFADPSLERQGSRFGTL